MLVAEPEPNLKPARSTTLPPGKTPSGLSDAGAQIHNFVQGQKSDTGNPIVTFPKPSAYIINSNSLAQSSITTLQQASTSTSTSTSSVDSVIQLHHKPVAQSSDTILQKASTTSSPVAPVIQFLGIPIAQSTSRINHPFSSSSDNYNTLLTPFPHLASKIRPHATASNIYQTSSNSNPSPTTPSDLMLPDHPPAQFSPTTTVDVVLRPLADQTIVAEATASSAVELPHGLLGNTGILPPGASITPGKLRDSAIQSGGDGGGGSDGSGSFTLGGSSATRTGSGTESDSATGTGSPTGSTYATKTDSATSIASTTTTGTGSVTPSSISTENGTTTGISPTPPLGNPPASLSTQTTIPTVSTGQGAKRLMHGCSNRWLDFTMLLCGVGMVYI